MLTKYLLFFLFALSGFAGLIYESIWTHYIKLILGHSAYAQSLVLIIFMGGMAIGAIIISRISNQIANPLLWYACLEGVIGLFGISFHQEFLWFQQLLFNSVLPGSGTAIVADLIKWLFASVMLLPQAILLGATFPLMSAAIVRIDQQHSGHTLSTLYFTNSIGAAIGVLFSGFVLIELVGLPGTTLTAGMINILLALVVWLLAKNIQPAPAMTTAKNEANLNSPERTLLIVALLTGAASFFYEIGWIRMLSLVLGSSVQAFELMLSAFIAGLAFGSFFIRRRLDSLKRPWFYLAWVQILMGLLATATLPLYTGSFSFMSYMIEALTKTDAGYSLFMLSSHLIAFAVMLPATFLAGMTLPMITNLLLKIGGNESAIGKIYSVNTFGAILGVILAINLIMPAIGVKGLIVFGGLIDLGLGVFLLWKFSANFRTNYRETLALASVFVAVIFFSMTPFEKSLLSSGVYRLGQIKLAKDTQLKYYQDGKTATVSMLEHSNGSMSIRTNGKTDALINPANLGFSTDEITMVMAGALPLVLHPDVKTVANIGMGSGLTTHTLLASEKVQQIDTIEIESGMIEGARHFGQKVERTFTDPRSKIYIDDAKSFFSTQQKRYDVIVSEPSNPWVNGVASLFTYEFYQSIQPYLNKNGILVQWLQLYEIDENNVTSVFKALHRSFKFIRIYNTTHTDLIIVASNDNPLDKQNSDIFKSPKLSADLHRVGVDNLMDLAIRYLGDNRVLAPFLISKNIPINSDFFPYLSQHAPISRYKQENAAHISWLHSNDIPVLSWLNNNNISDKLSDNGNYFLYYPNHQQANFLINGLSDQISDKELAIAVEFVNSLDNMCDKLHINMETLIASTLIIAANANPYLPPNTLDTYWSQLIGRCHSNHKKTAIETWLHLHHAISQRHIERTLKYAKIIHSNKAFANNRQQEYLVTSILVAYLSANKSKEAIQFIERFNYFKKLQAESLALKMLISIAVAGLKN